MRFLNGKIKKLRHCEQVYGNTDFSFNVHRLEVLRGLPTTITLDSR